MLGHGSGVNVSFVNLQYTNFDTQTIRPHSTDSGRNFSRRTVPLRLMVSYTWLPLRGVAVRRGWAGGGRSRISHSAPTCWRRSSTPDQSIGIIVEKASWEQDEVTLKTEKSFKEKNFLFVFFWFAQNALCTKFSLAKQLIFLCENCFANPQLNRNKKTSSYIFNALHHSS